MSRSCRRRPCASLPRRRASAAAVAALREDIAALDAGLVSTGQAADLALIRVNTLGRVLAAGHETPQAKSAAVNLSSLHVIPGGAA